MTDAPAPLRIAVLDDHQAMARGLGGGRRLAGAGLDVFNAEPLPVDHPLRTMPTVLATRHIGYISRATYEAAFPQMVEDIAACRRGTPVRVLEGWGGATTDGMSRRLSTFCDSLTRDPQIRRSRCDTLKPRDGGGHGSPRSTVSCIPACTNTGTEADARAVAARLGSKLQL